MNQRAKKWITFVLRWGIAVVGIWWVVAQMEFRDRVWILDPKNYPVPATLSAYPDKGEQSAVFEIWDPWTYQKRSIARDAVVNRPDQKEMVLAWYPIGTNRATETEKHGKLLALDLSDDVNGGRATEGRGRLTAPQPATRVERLLVEDHEKGVGVWIHPLQLKTPYQLRVPHPKLEVGIVTLVWLANPYLLILCVLIFPVTFVITTFRWHKLLEALDIRIGVGRAFVLTMVGAFYNTFMPGSTGGDVLKAYYASKHTTHRTRAVLSVIIDRVIGLLALVIMGGVMASIQYWRSPLPDDPVTRACRRVAIGSALILLMVIGGMMVFFTPALRRLLGVDYILSRLPMQKQVQNAIEVMKIYKRRPALVLWALLITFPVHITVVISAMLAGMAFKLPLPSLYYFVVVPVVVLVGAIPISPQGAGVMEFFAIQLTKQYGMTVGQAFALTMSIRLVQMAWNLTGGIFVFRGGYHAPNTKEREEMERDGDSPARTIATTGEAPVPQR
jgi:uncharacterized protein (TIRG00374 family)